MLNDKQLHGSGYRIGRSGVIVFVSEEMLRSRAEPQTPDLEPDLSSIGEFVKRLPAEMVYRREQFQSFGDPNTANHSGHAIARRKYWLPNVSAWRGSDPSRAGYVRPLRNRPVDDEFFE